MSEDFDWYLGIANHDIQMANNIGELKSYVANILYDNDKKVELLQQRDNIIKEVRECINHYAIENENYSKIYNDEEKELLEILDKVGDEV